MIVEIDDEGPLFNESGQRDRMREWLMKDDAPIVVFINGWHHNAEPGDKNLLSFERFLASIRYGSGQALRGLYVGWRGDSVDILNLPEPVDFFTIWGRKNASVAVGESGLRAILSDIEHYTERRAFIIAHSLGASALFHAVKDDFAEDINDGFEYLMLNPAVSAKEFEALEAQITAAFGRTSQVQAGEQSDVAAAGSDSAILRVDRKLVVLQALGDRAVGLLYRLAFLGRVPIGFQEESLSHRAYLCKSDDACTATPCRRVFDETSFAIEARGMSDSECEAAWEAPVWVTSADKTVSADHNDILNGPQQGVIINLLSAHLQIQTVDGPK
jgi:hypothetical protein